MDNNNKAIDTTVELPEFKTKGRLSVQDIMGMEAPFLRKKAELSAEATKAKGEELQAKQTQAETEATGVSEAFRKGAEQEKQVMQKYKADMEANPLPAFVPSKEDAGDLGLLFTLTNILGFAVGAKGNAQAALSAMNGMLEGHRKGREDLYKREKDEFDKNFKVLVEKQKTLRQEMEDAIKLMQTDKEAGVQAAHLAAIRSGSDIVKAQVSQGRFIDALTQVDDNQKVTENALALVEKQREKDLEYNRQISLKKLDTGTLTPFIVTENGKQVTKLFNNKTGEITNAKDSLVGAEKVGESARLAAKLDAEERKEILKLDPSIRNRLTQYPSLDVKSVLGIKPANQVKVVNSLESVEKIESIGNFIRANPDAVGFLANLANQSNINTLDSLASWEKMVDSNANMPETAKTLNKMLTTQAYRDVAATGQRPTVYLDKVFKDLYSQNSSPTSLLSILKERQKDADMILSEYKMDLKNNENYNNYELFKEDPREYMKSAMFIAPDGSQVSALDVEDTAKKRKINFAKVVRDLKLKPAGTQ